jgi:anti-sigma factor RsiW
MIEHDCGSIRELLPDLAAGRRPAGDAGSLHAHLADCADCRAELELVRALFAQRAAPPAGLALRVVAAVRRDGARSTRPWWGLTAAAVAALALGIGIASEPSATARLDVPGYAQETEEGVVWSSEDGLVAGAPLWDDLTDEGLEQLLNELSVGSSGGAA